MLLGTIVSKPGDRKIENTDFAHESRIPSQIRRSQVTRSQLTWNCPTIQIIFRSVNTSQTLIQLFFFSSQKQENKTVQYKC